MQFRAPCPDLAIPMLLTSGVTSDNDDLPPDGSADHADGFGAAGSGGGIGSQDEEPIAPDGVPNSFRLH